MKTLATIEIRPPYFDPLIDSLWASPEQVLALVQDTLKDICLARASSPEISFASWNAEYLWRAKALHFCQTYKEIASKHHLIALQEVSVAALSYLSKETGYNYMVSKPNSRGQAVGFLIHPRFIIKGITEYADLIRVNGISNLRPALGIDLIDKDSQQQLSVITVHLKSMLGGIIETSSIRHEQLKRLVTALPNIENTTLIAGDFNCFIDASNDIVPLLDNGFTLANKSNHTSTQIRGGRLDGLFYQSPGNNFEPTQYQLHNFWHQGLIGRSLSDHGLLSWTLAF